MFTPSDGQANFFSYLEPGDTLDVSFIYERREAAHAERLTVTDPNGAVQFTCDFGTGANIGRECAVSDLGGVSGVWTITMTQITNAAGVTPRAYGWSIDVNNGGGNAVPGRTWTNEYNISQDNAGTPTPLADLDFWLVNDSGYQYAVDLNGYNGVYSTIAANSVGVADASCVPTYQSASSARIAAENLRVDCEPHYRVFFDAPAADLPVSAPSAAGDVLIAPEPLLAADLAVDDLEFAPSVPGAPSGTFMYSIGSRFTGAYELQVDTDGNGSYDDAVDRTITLAADGSGSYSYSFDGLDGQGAPIAACTTMNARIHYDSVGEMHVLQSDVEGRAGGIAITRLNGDGAPDSTIYWDDTNITDPRDSTTPVLDGTGGVNSTGGVHGWAYSGNSWGNNTYIDDWTFAPLDFGTGEIAIAGLCLDIEKTSDATENTRVGDTVTYTVSATNVGDTDYTADAPATFTDDLSGILDDATYNDDAASDVAGEIAYAEPKLSWTGALAAGDTVTLTYTATVVAGGDGVARNVAYGSTPDIPTPACNPPTDEGTDPATGIACAEDVFELPRLTITKSASETELPIVGTEVTYTVTATNAGPGVFTDDAPATVTDDLTEVIDDATYNDDATATVGDDPIYDEPELTWTGALASGASVTMEYTVTYTGEGDQQLVNTACVPEEDALPGTDPCAVNAIPGAALNQWKTVEASDSPLGVGDTLTYTLHFESFGEIPAPVDAIDDLTHVLDDADVTVEPASQGGVTAVRDGETITITGAVEPGTTATVTYTVTLRADGERGDNIAANFLLDPGDVPPTDPDCVPADEEFPDCTVNLIPELVDSKSVSPASGTTVVPGQTLTYTLTFENIGAGAGPVNRVDDVTHILDDAKITSGPTASNDALAVSSIVNGRFSITGELAGGQTVTVTYTVVVNEYDDLGDTELGNFLLDPTDPTPSDPSDCVPGSEDCTYNPVPRLVDTKTSDPASGTQVVAGEVLTYTLTFGSTGSVPVTVDRVDDLTHILDDATVRSQPTVSDDALSVSAISDGRFSITGELAVGQTVTVTYTVVVKPNESLGDARLGNFLLDPSDPTPSDPSSCVAGSGDCTYHPVDAPGRGLVVTGSVLPWSTMGAALLILALGASMVVASRRRGEAVAIDG
jgi:fimbrial isopeptide formation D2 family protein